MYNITRRIVEYLRIEYVSNVQVNKKTLEQCQKSMEKSAEEDSEKIAKYYQNRSQQPKEEIKKEKK